MTVIAMAFEAGTHSRQIATLLAARLGIEFADIDYLRDRIADRLAPRIESHGPHSLSPNSFRAALEMDDHELARTAEDEIRELAAYGNILLRGWGAAYFLRDSPGVVRVRTVASLKYRLAVLAAHHPELSKAERLAVIVENDKCLSSNLEPILGSAWTSPDLYHLAVDVEALGPIEAAREIECFVRPECASLVRPQRRLPT